MDSKEYKVNKVNAYNGWDPLKQVLLGNVFEPEFFENVGDHKLRDLLQQILYETHEDLTNIRKTLEDLGVEVIQGPRNTIAGGEFDTIEDVMATFKQSHIRNIPRPCLMPRDNWITLGDKIIHTGFENLGNANLFNPDIVDWWREKGLIERKTGELTNDFWAPQIIRIGNKLIIDEEDNPNLGEKVLERYPQFKHTSSVIVGGHTDGVMCLPKPGLVIHAPWIDGNIFKETLPGWDVCTIQNPNQMTSDLDGFQSWFMEKKITDGRWWTPEAKSNPDLVKFVDSWLNEWVGFAEESVFEVNMLSISENIILSLNHQPQVHAALRKHNIEPIYCRFRHRNFWDGGLHCLTLDTYREGGMQDYFA